ncbi:SAYSvFN domain-containing protein 1 [Colletes gigas]|uniref:SAYSvFN domain-containing protein 1 n=1 Tax=Colletes gigas TaxID=935657 RepID=UPI001C9BB595|nr:SAYSvFN domain-containing protein 1 [Colletes gigas]
MYGLDIKEKLNAYRRQRRRQEMTNIFKNTIQIPPPWNGDETIKDSLPTTLLDDVEDVKDMESTCSDDSIDRSRYTVIQKVTYLLYFLLWVTLYIIMIKFEFGAVYFVFSALIFMWLNTRSRPKKLGELSAYSVFNPDCKAIEGTLDASQFEREIRYGIGSVR